MRRGSAADRAGLALGDELLSWSRAARPPANPLPAAGTLASPFDLMDVLVEQLPRGTVTLAGRRRGEERRWVLPAGQATCWFLAEDVLAVWEEKEVITAPLLPPVETAGVRDGAALEAAGDLDGAAAAWGRAAAAANSRGDSLLASWLLGRAAKALAAGGHGAPADDAFRRAAALAEPRSATAAAHLLRAWGNARLRRRAGLPAAEAFRRAAELDRRAGPGTLAEAWSLTGLGHVAALAPGATDSSDLYLQVRQIRERAAPGSADVAASFFDSCTESYLGSSPVAAAASCAEAARRAEEVAPESLDLAEKLAMLGRVRRLAGDGEGARIAFERARAIAVREGPGDPLAAFAFEGLGQLAGDRGDLPAAREGLARAVSWWRQSAPPGLEERELLRQLAAVEHRLGDRQASRDHFCGAMALDEEYRRRFERDNPHEYLRLGAWFAEDFRDCARALVAAGEPERAFAVMERGRARGFLRSRAERGLRAAMRETEAAGRWRALDAEYDRAQEELAEATPGTPARIRASGRMEEILRQKDALVVEARDRWPERWAAQPAPLSLEACRRALDPGTVLVAWSVGDEATVAFVVHPAGSRRPGLTAVELPVGSADLWPRVIRWRRLLRDPASDPGEVAAQGTALYDLLLRPLEPALAGGRRLLLVPEGPLAFLPFPALRRDGRYLIEGPPLHRSLSATVYAALRRDARRRRPPLDLVAFGDPLYLAAAGVQQAFAGRLEPLPASRREVQRIAALFPRSRVLLGEAASETQAVALGGQARLLHFAVHGFVDAAAPQSSALALTTPRPPAPGRDNGLLQAWEITDRLRLAADLVTLSACDTARGVERGGEGLQGLTQAFLQAGARSVVASQWSVADEATAALMERFYRRLRQGWSKDRALADAERALLRTRRWSHPYFWAAFELAGDWR